MAEIVTIGEALVEIMADAPGQGFREPLALHGPYPSGAPAIFIDQVARMGASAGIITAIGADDFGALIRARLASDGVDTAALAIAPDRPTGSAFVRYRPDGARDFVFNIAHSACASIGATPEAEALIAGARHLHVVGTALFSEPIRALTLAAARAIRARGGTVSFDPNLRRELADAPERAATIAALLALTDLFLPSDDELFLGVETGDREAALAAHVAAGRRVVHKRGAAGATYADATLRIESPGFPVTEIDPTGAGDCFDGAFVALWRAGEPPEAALRLACAAGALAVSRRGPMEGAHHLAEIRAFADRQGAPDA